MTTRRNIGLDRRIDLQWLDGVAGLVAAGEQEPTIRPALFRLLDGAVQGGSKRGSACYKTVGVLSKAWVKVSPQARALRDRAAHLLPQCNSEERLALHWALLLATYPFFADVAASIGRLLTLQGNLTLAQLTRRLREDWGDRSTLTRAVQRVVRSLVQWGALTDGDRRGVYLPPRQPVSVSQEVGELLLEALLLRLAGESLSVDQVPRHPCFFPFQVELPALLLRRSPRFEIHRQGLDVDVVTLARSEAHARRDG
ncbi:MAG: hypothetical protein RBU45_23445 [Myxococcota bacterium]|jgi:hypothetical protein|nr:hypothetical protein [Myxococcota bacterium]